MSHPFHLPSAAEELLERVWDEMADPFTTAVKVAVSRLRRKLGDPPIIQTMAQSGYRIGGWRRSRSSWSNPRTNV